jgi:DNA-binding IclR family transcriptional regulator
MSSATKTFELLWYFSEMRPEIGLSHLCKLAHRDKATTYRHLQALEKAGFVEQNPQTKHYRLGPAVLQLAQTRETTVPRKTGAKEPLMALSEAVGETAHVSVLSGITVYPLLAVESPKHATRAIIDIPTFPLHATASGICAVAFGPTGMAEAALENMQAFTSKTPVTAQELDRMVQEARQTGFCKSNQSYEEEIQSISTPIFDQTGLYAGAVAVASVATRSTPQLEQIILYNLTLASREITRNWGGTIPPYIDAAWAKTLSHNDALETAT